MARAHLEEIEIDHHASMDNEIIMRQWRSECVVECVCCRGQCVVFPDADCDACRGSGTSYWEDDIYGSCMLCLGVEPICKSCEIDRWTSALDFGPCTEPFWTQPIKEGPVTPVLTAEQRQKNERNRMVAVEQRMTAIEQRMTAFEQRAKSVVASEPRQPKVIDRKGTLKRRTATTNVFIDI